MGLVDSRGQPIASTPLREDEAIARMVTEIRSLEDRPCELVFPPDVLLRLVGLLQLAGRHPSLTPFHDETLHEVIDAAREYFCDCPTVLEVIRRGDDPTEDVPDPRVGG